MIYLDIIPKISKDLCWTKKNDLVEIIMENKGFYNFLMQKLIHKPRKSIIHLDEIGSFIWQNIDGKSSTDEIALKLEKKFGEKVLPIKERFDKYVKILCDNNFITLNKV